MSTTLDTVQRNGVNSALSVATGAVSVNGSIGTTNNGSVLTSGIGSIYTSGTGDMFTISGSIFAGGVGNVYTSGTGSIFTVGTGSILTLGTGNIYTTDGDITVGGASKHFNGAYLTPSELLISDGSKNIVSAPVATYPSLTELTYLKGVTSDIQTQINGKQSTITFGTGVQTALGINIGSAGAPVLFNGALGTPSSGTLTNATGLPQSGVTNLTTDLGLKAPLANPTFTGVVTIPTPFTLGATSVTSTGTQLNYLSSATGTTGTTSTNLVFSTSPTLVTPNLGTPSALVGTNITGTASGLTAGNVTTNANLTGPITSVGNATSIASQTGTGTKFVVDNTPTLITPILGVASATSMNVGGGTLNGVVNALSTTDISLASTAHPLTVGGASTSTNLVLGEYNSALGIQARNNGASANLFLQGDGGGLSVGNGALTGQRIFAVNNTGAGTGDYSSIEVRNGSAGTDALRLWCTGTGSALSGSNVQDAAIVTSGTGLSGGMSLGALANAPVRLYSNNANWFTLLANGNFVGVSTGALGYGTGAGGTVTQATSKATGVTLNKLSGEITLNNAVLNAGTIVSFTLTNSTLTATDVLVLNHVTTGTLGAYTLNAQCNAGTATISVRNNTAGNLTEAIVIRYATIKGSTN